MSEENKIRVGISMGDPNGIGPEVIIKALADNRMLQTCTPVIYGSAKAITFYRKLANNNEFQFNSIRSGREMISRKINVVNCWEEEIKIEPGVKSTLSGGYAYKALQNATSDLVNATIDVLVTAPVDKHSIQPEGAAFTGHTEYLASAFNTTDYLMILASENVRVALVTGHVPLATVPQIINTELIVKKLQLLNHSLKRDFGIRKPKIAVLGLNPHAGDNGVLGKEDADIIAPAIKEVFDKGMPVYGPYPADGIFGSGQFKKFDAVLAMYHDQGLIPFKTLAFETGVNFTAGLPMVRTSPDHGTGYDIAGKGIASETSLREAIYMGCDIFQRRKEYDELNEKPLAYSKFGGDR